MQSPTTDKYENYDPNILDDNNSVVMVFNNL